MKKPKSIFYFIYFLFHVMLLGVSIYVNYRSEDFEFLLKLRSQMDILTYVSVVGLVLFGINIVLISMEHRNHKKTKEKLEGEVNAIKAKMYDLQDATGQQKDTKAVEPDTQKGEDIKSDKEE
ncbi:MAG: hypothetical protein R3345_09155 [Fulvivirga sp.]|nr:hypothetical protein [Fulvivirga sp.]